MVTEDRCAGCSVYKDGDGDYCEHTVHNNEAEGICPCSQCIVKPMCQVACKEWQDWMKR